MLIIKSWKDVINLLDRQRSAHAWLFLNFYQLHAVLAVVIKYIVIYKLMQYH